MGRKSDAEICAVAPQPKENSIHLRLSNSINKGFEGLGTQLSKLGYNGADISQAHSWKEDFFPLPVMDH